MDWQRTAILGAIAATSFMLILEWKEFQDKRAPIEEFAPTLSSSALPSIPKENDTKLVEAPEPKAIEDNEEIPQLEQETPEKPPVVIDEAASAQLVKVFTDTLEVTIDTKGGDIVKVALLKHLHRLDNPDQPFVLLNRTQNQTYTAQSGLIGKDGTETKGERPIFSAPQSSYRLLDGQETLEVDLVFNQGSVQITKQFIFTRGEHLIQLNYLVDNQGTTPWKAALYGQIKRDGTPVENNAPAMGIQPYLGAAISTSEENYKKIDFEDLADMAVNPDKTRRSFKTEKNGGWIAMVQHYFLSAWIPDQELNNHFKLRRAQDREIYYLEFTSPSTTVDPGTKGVLKASFYAGPKNIKRLEQISPYLDLTVDYGWLWWIAKPLFYFLQWIYSYIGSWGWSIIALTIIIKAAFFQLSAASYKSMAKMRQVQPKMQDLKDRYGDNRQKMSEELMKLYKKEKVNPLGGCLPILVQMPVFIALYWVLMESVELRHTPFLGWIKDLSVMDPYFILPLIMGGTMWIQQKLNPTPPDPMQARIMQMMPVVFTVLFLWFPAGLVLYWVVNNTLSIAQQYVITKRIEAKG